MKSSMLSHTLSTVLCAFLLCGCVHGLNEGFPDLTYSTLSPDKLPGSVKDTFIRLHPDGAIERVETSLRKGKIGQYRISFRTTAGVFGSEVFTASGSRMPSPGAFPPIGNGP